MEDYYTPPSVEDHSYRPSLSQDRLIPQSMSSAHYNNASSHNRPPSPSRSPAPMSQLQPGQIISSSSPYAPYAQQQQPQSAFAYPPKPMGGRGMTGPVGNGSGGEWVQARDRMMKRRSVRHVPLKEGNLVVDVPGKQIVP
jgi:hypothetical protein